VSLAEGSFPDELLPYQEPWLAHAAILGSVPDAGHPW